MNGPTGYAWNHALCYRLPVMYEPYRLAFKCQLFYACVYVLL